MTSIGWRAADRSELYSFGRNTCGELGAGHLNVVSLPNQVRFAPNVPCPLPKLVSIACGIASSFAVAVGTMGDITMKRAFDGSEVPPIADTVVRRAVRADGTVFAWGLNSHGHLGVGDELSRSLANTVQTPAYWAAKKVTVVAAGGRSAMFIA